MFSKKRAMRSHVMSLPAPSVIAVALAAANAAAQPPPTDLYEAQLARPAPVAEVTVGGVEWHCEGVTCLAESSRDLANVKACRVLSDEVGRIVSFGRSGGGGLDDSVLETCNGGRAARGTAAREPDDGDAGEDDPRPAADSRAAEVVSGPITQRAGDLIAPPLPAAPGFEEPEPFVYYKIRNRNSDKPAAVSGGHVRNGASVIQWADRDQRDVFWRAIPAGDGTYKLKNRNSGRFLAVSGGRRDNGQNVIQWDDNDQGDVHWRFEPVGDGYAKIRNAGTGRILIVPEGMSDNGANIVQWQDVDRSHAQWRLQPAADIAQECSADRNLARREGPDTRPDLEVQDIQIKNVKVDDGDIVLLHVEALIRNRSASAWRGRGKYAFVHANGGNRLIKPGTVGALLDSPIAAGETIRVSDLFVVPAEQKNELSLGRFMKAVATGGASEAGNAVRAVRERYLNDDGEPTRDLEALMQEGTGVPSNLEPLFPTGQRQTIQLQLEAADGGDRWSDDIRLCNNFLQLSFVVDRRGVAQRFRMTQKGPDSYRDFHRVRVTVRGN